ncbi:MAG: response regulator [Tepidisphaeraceae bacterium]
MTRLRILYLEDHADTADVVLRLLTRERHDVVLATTLRAAESLCEQRVFDLLVCDIQLPDGNGQSLLAHARRTAPNTRGIVLSAHGRIEDTESSRNAGFIEHLTKPVTFEALCDAIRRVMEQPAKSSPEREDAKAPIDPEPQRVLHPIHPA